MKMKYNRSEIKVLWELPTPSSGFSDVTLKELPSRCCYLKLGASYENDLKCNTLILNGIEAYKCTYMYALTLDMIETSYDKLVDMGRTEWLVEVEKLVAEETDSLELRHLRICFDDGPCYEFICSTYEVLIAG